MAFGEAAEEPEYFEFFCEKATLALFVEALRLGPAIKTQVSDYIGDDNSADREGWRRGGGRERSHGGGMAQSSCIVWQQQQQLVPQRIAHATVANLEGLERREVCSRVWFLFGTGAGWESSGSYS